MNAAPGPAEFWSIWPISLPSRSKIFDRVARRFSGSGVDDVEPPVLVIDREPCGALERRVGKLTEELARAVELGDLLDGWRGDVDVFLRVQRDPNRLGNALDLRERLVGEVEDKNRILEVICDVDPIAVFRHRDAGRLADAVGWRLVAGEEFQQMFAECCVPTEVLIADDGPDELDACR